MSRSPKPRRSLAEHFARAGRTHALVERRWQGPDALAARASRWRCRLDPLGRPELSAADPHTRDPRAARLEAVLFLAREPLNTRRLAQLAHLADGTEARTLVRQLNRWYDETGSPFTAVELAGGYQLMSRPQFAGWLRRLYQPSDEVRLSSPALETLAVVAYRQPVVRAEIEAIRGVDCGEILRQLMDRNLLRATGRAEELGRPYVYATTKRFLQVFGLRHLDDLPRAGQLRNAGDSVPQTDSQTSDCSTRDGESRHETGTPNYSIAHNEEGIERDH